MIDKNFFGRVVNKSKTEREWKMVSDVGTTIFYQLEAGNQLPVFERGKVPAVIRPVAARVRNTVGSDCVWNSSESV